MKKIFCIFLISILLCCDNSLDINEEWRDVPVIYGILNPGTEFDNNYDHYVRIQKSFLGVEPANSYVGVYDSIYYNTDDLAVWLEFVEPSMYLNVESGETQGPFPLELVTINESLQNELSKNEGLFYSDNHYLYKIPNIEDEDGISIQNLTNCFSNNQIVRINVLNYNTGDTAFAETNIVEPIDILRPKPSGQTSVFQFGSGVNQYIEVKNSENAKMYSITLRFNYWEQHVDDYLLDVSDNGIIDRSGAVLKYIELSLGNQEPTSLVTNLQVLISPLQFLEFLATQIKGDDYYRYPAGTYYQGTGAGMYSGLYHQAIDLRISAVNAELYTYINANAPNYGFNQERPEYNNITNGIGHWSSRSLLKLDSLKLDNSSMNLVTSESLTSGLNFACYAEPPYGDTNNIGVLDVDGFYLQFGYDCLND